MIATFVNCLTIIIGSLAGVCGARKIQAHYKEVVFNSVGLMTLVLGFSMASKSSNLVYLSLALIAGGLVGTWADLESAILHFGVLLERLGKAGVSRRVTKNSTQLSAHQEWNFGHAFLQSSVLFCVGAMALVGSFKAGTEGDYTLILTKSVLDGCIAFFLGATLGPGISFSALSVLVYQGGLTLAAGILSPLVSANLIAELTGLGGTMVIMIGLNLLGLKQIKTANFLPGLLVTIGLVAVDPFVKKVGGFIGL